MHGQEKIINQFNNFSLSTLPHSVILVGASGCGKHTLCNYIKTKFNLEIYNCDGGINLDVVELMNNFKSPTLCVIDGDSITDKEEAVLLKFVEEPNPNIFIYIICTSETNILDTIINRCIIYKFAVYSKEYLNTLFPADFNNDEKKYILSVAQTPGDVQKYISASIQNMIGFADKILSQVSVANLSNIFKIVEKIDFSNDNNGLYNLDIFLNVLKYCALTNVKLNNSKAFEQYKIVNKLYNNCQIKNINKKQLFEHFLFELKGVN